MNLYQFFSDKFCSSLDLPFLTSIEGTSLTYRDVDTRSAELAGALVLLGAVQGDRVVVQVDKSPDAVALYFACLRSGLVYVPINTAYTADEVRYFVSDAEASVFVCSPDRLTQLGQALDSATNTVTVTMGKDRDGTLCVAAEQAEPSSNVITRQDSDLAAMLYTSGTTGRSKGAMLTHLGLRTNALALHQVWAFEPGDVLLHTLPIFHVHGLFVALHCAILNGSEVIFCERFSPEIVISQIPRVTVFMGVPTHYVRLLANPDFDADLCKNMRLFTSGSAPMTEPVFAQFYETTQHQICERYGMTECGIITSNPYEGDRVAGTVGHALPGYEIRVSNDDGAVQVGEVGIVEVRGDHLFAGYWRMPDKTAEEMSSDGFFKTGDVGQLDESARLTLAGRSGDMIISGGYNVYPKEIESVIDDIDGILESAVVGLPHSDFGEAVTAFIVVDSDLADVPTAVADACSGPLARFKHPKECIVVDELPRNTMGKVQKAELRRLNSNLYS